LGTEGGYPTENIELCRVYQTERRTTIVPLGSWWKHHHMCLFNPWWRVPKGWVYGRRLVFVSERTNKRHHHHQHVRSHAPLPSPLDIPRCLWGLPPQCMVRRPPGRSDPAPLRVVTEALREGRSVELRDRGLRRAVGGVAGPGSAQTQKEVRVRQRSLTR
jgi:hypothetical protein